MRHGVHCSCRHIRCALPYRQGPLPISGPGLEALGLYWPEEKSRSSTNREGRESSRRWLLLHACCLAWP